MSAPLSFTGTNMSVQSFLANASETLDDRFMAVMPTAIVYIYDRLRPSVPYQSPLAARFVKTAISCLKNRGHDEHCIVPDTHFDRLMRCDSWQNFDAEIIELIASTVDDNPAAFLSYHDEEAVRAVFDDLALTPTGQDVLDILEAREIEVAAYAVPRRKSHLVRSFGCYIHSERLLETYFTARQFNTAARRPFVSSVLTHEARHVWQHHDPRIEELIERLHELTPMAPLLVCKVLEADARMAEARQLSNRLALDPPSPARNALTDYHVSLLGCVATKHQDRGPGYAARMAAATVFSFALQTQNYYHNQPACAAVRALPSFDTRWPRFIDDIHDGGTRAGRAGHEFLLAVTRMKAGDSYLDIEDAPIDNVMANLRHVTAQYA